MSLEDAFESDCVSLNGEVDKFTACGFKVNQNMVQYLHRLNRDQKSLK